MHKPYLDWMHAQLDNQLTADETLTLNLHLAECAECQTHWQMLAEMHQLFLAEPPARPRPGFTGRFKARLTQQRARPRAMWGALALGLSAIGAAALVLPAGLSLFFTILQAAQEPAATAAMLTGMRATNDFALTLADALTVIGWALLRAMIGNPLTGVVVVTGLALSGVWLYFMHKLFPEVSFR